MHHEKTWRSKAFRAARISVSTGPRKSSTSSSCSIVSERLSLHPNASREAATAQGCTELPVEPVRPGTPDPAGKHPPRRSEVLLAPVVRPQVLLEPEVLADTDLAGVEGLEDEAIPVTVVDDLRYPRRPAPPAPGEEDRVPM